MGPAGCRAVFREGEGLEKLQQCNPRCWLEGSTAGSVLVRAFPSHPTLPPWLQTQHFQLCRVSPILDHFPAALCDGISSGVSSKNWQVAGKKAGSFAEPEVQSESRQGCVGNTMFAHLRVMLDFR